MNDLDPFFLKKNISFLVSFLILDNINSEIHLFGWIYQHIKCQEKKIQSMI